MAYPNPPDHYRLFTTPNALPPPSSVLLDALEFYPMFGRPVPNIRHPNNSKIETPNIDSDIIMYDLRGDLRVEAKQLTERLPEVVDDLLMTMQTNPDTCNEQLRRLDNVIKNIYHLLEVSREHEALSVLINLAESRVQAKRKILKDLESTTTAALSCLESN